jgi:hypothetical protein
MRVVIDSGVLYSVTLLVALILYVRNSNAQYILVDMVGLFSSLLPQFSSSHHVSL